MREFSMSGEVELQRDDHLLEPLIRHAEEQPDLPLFSRPRGERFAEVSAGSAYARVRDLAKGLMALGVEAGDSVSIMSSTRLEFTLLDYAVLAAGAVTVPIYETDSAEQIEWICTDSDVRLVVLENDDLKSEYDKVSSGLGVKDVFIIDDGGLDQIAEAGSEVTVDALDGRLADLTTDDLACIIYTSGTTGRPKGCELTHGNLRWDAVNTLKATEDFIRQGERQLLFLPLAHSFAKILLLASVEAGVTIGFSRGIDHLRDEMPVFRPTFLAAVPRVFEKVWSAAERAAEEDGKGGIFQRAADVAERWSREEQDGGAALTTRLMHAVFDRLVYSKVRAVFGGDLENASSGGGPLSDRLNHIFHGMGINIYEGYGLTETSPVLTSNRPGEWRIGTVGKPIPGTTIHIADDGEILAKGPQIFRGYHDNEEATDEAIDEDGWFHTGDIGELDSEGFLTITGRKKEILVTAGGKNVAPAVLEDRLKRHQLVSQAMVVGDNRKFIGALVTIDPEAFPRWAGEHGKTGPVADNVDDPDLRAEVWDAVEAANEAVSRAESIREFRILPEDFTIEGGELTPTMKVKRRVVEDTYQDVIEDIYS